MDALEAAGRAEGTAVVFLYDHGEEFFEHTFSHLGGVWEHLARVPLLLRLPGEPPRRVDDRVARLIDVAPTALAALGVSAPAGWQGVDLLAAPPPRWAVTERGRSMAITPDRRRKAIRQVERGRTRYYDLAADPLEASPLPAAAQTETFEPLFEAWASATPAFDPAGAGAPLAGEAAAEHVEALRSLGYVE